jgi:hypothetical protein
VSTSHPISSHIKNSSSSGRSASSLRLPTKKEAPTKLTTRCERSLDNAKLTCKESSSTTATLPMNVSGIPPFVTSVNFSTVLEFFHIRNFSNASLDEAIFLHILYGSLATQARLLAAILPYSVQRPLRALFAAMNERPRNHSAGSAKRKGKNSR